MAQIDLRHATVYIRDGYTATGTVNESSPAPASGDTSLTVSGFTKAIANGATFTVVGSTRTYTVTGTTGGATPTAITFTPALATADGVPANGATVTIGPNKMKIVIGEGNLTYEEKRDMEYIRNQRQIYSVRTGDDQPLDVSFDFIWEFVTADTGQPPTVEDALKNTGNASTWVTSGSDPCEPYAVDIEVLYTPPCPGVKQETILLKEYRWESGNHDLKAGTISSKGKCKVLSPIVTRQTNTLVA